MIKFKLLFILFFISFSKTAISQVNSKSNGIKPAQQTVKVSGKAYVITRTLTGVQGVYSDNPPPTTYISGDTLLISNKKLTFYNEAGKKYTVQTNQKGYFSVNLPPGNYTIHQPESLSGTSQEFDEGTADITVLSIPKCYKVIFYNTDNSQNTIPQRAN